MKQKYRVALAGNPNCGKTCIFNALTGARQHVGNYPGVTVESKSGSFTLNGIDIELVDLPGVYSLSSSSPEEEVVFQELTTPGIDLIINVIDSSIPQRSLYLTTQLAELHIPMLLTFNMSDDAKEKGLKFDIAKLEKYFGAPIVQTIGSKSGGVRPLLTRLASFLEVLDDHGMPMLTYGADVDDAIRAVAEKIDALNIEKYAHIPSRFFAIKLLENDTSAMSIPEFKPVYGEVSTQINHLWDVHAIDADTFMADRRYAMLAGACRDTITFTQEKRREISDKIDSIVTNKFLGLPIFLVVMYFTFWFTFTLADPLMGYIEDGFAWLGEFIGGYWNEESLPFLRNMVIDGIIGGVGGVVVFLPNILFLFFAIALLEDSGYMSRAAYVMDGIMRIFGLQGRSFVPLVLGFGCTVPAIMATRTIESERDRKVTIMVLPLMSCGARLPIYALLIPAFFAKEYQAFTLWLIYIIGIVVALVAALLMRKTIFKGDGEVYLMELPPYRVPTLKSMMLHMWDRGWMYLQKAGTIILATSIILYICNTYPEKEEFSRDYDAEKEQIVKADGLNDQEIAEIGSYGIFDEETISAAKEERTISQETIDGVLEPEEGEAPALTDAQSAMLEKISALNDSLTALDNAQAQETFEYTVSGRIGTFLEPFFKPVGFDARIATATIGALAAKEVFVSQMGILYSAGEADGENKESDTLRSILQKKYTPLQAFCMMIFCLLSIPCLATLAIIKRELNSWKMAIVEGAGLFALAYLLTLIVYQIGSFLQIGTKLIG